ncbi:MAG: CusA/CzcA family heavy metal efflux RND transporter [Candidatus Eisenbacteria bacterium]|nr:CusA/CzcA family heavy metal efflux RND transporter [Candidatus Eisenbacteria bacterium]
MLDGLIRFSLNNRLLVLVTAAVLLAVGAAQLGRLPVDIFPDLNQPVVTVLAEAHGLAPEEVETLVTLPLESALGGMPGVSRIRSTSGDGLAIVRVDFDWDTDLYLDRQLVQERLQLAQSDLPAGVVPEMAPIASITGEILDIGLTSPDGSLSPMELHTLAEWSIRRQLLSVPGVAQVVIIGGEKRQYQVLADPDLLLRHQIDIERLAHAVGEATRNTSGGYLVQDNRELLVRNLGRLRTAEELAAVVVSADQGRPVRVRDVARVIEGPQYKRGAAAVDGDPGVILVIFKQPDTNTLALTETLDRELEKIRAALPDGAELHGDLFRQATFLQRGVDNVVSALRDGALLVVLVLLLFLANLRASLITLLALPLSFATVGLVFHLLGLTLNTMTLGGLAIAIGELVDDAIVGVENVLRRLRRVASPELTIKERVARASSEVRGPIFTGTLIVILVFVPLFALSGIEGRLFTPLAIAYVAALLASMVVSLTVTPVLALLLFRKLGMRAKLERRAAPFALRQLQRAVAPLVTFAVRRRWWVVAGFTVLALWAVVGAVTVGNQFLPAFDEGTVLVMSFLPPGTSLEESDRIAQEMERRLVRIDGVLSVGRYTGRGEHDEHAPPPTISHFLLAIDPQRGFSREKMISRVRAELADVQGVTVNVGQPLAHRIDHILSGVQAQIVIKAMGTDLRVLRRTAARVAEISAAVPGVTDLYVEPQVLVPQVHIDLDRERLAEVGLSPGELAHTLEIAIGGKVVGSILEGERAFDLFVRLREEARASLADLSRLPIALPGGGWARLGELANVSEAAGPNSISRDNLLRRIAVSCNVRDRSLGEVVEDLRRALRPLEAELPEGAFLRFEGQFTSQMRATRLILLLSLGSLLAMILILYGQFRSLNLALQVLVCLPAAFVGGLALLRLTGQQFNVAALVGFVSLAGIASRNGILLVAHYLHLMREEGLSLDLDLLVRAARERAAPVVMTALTTGAGLLPLLLAAGETGREILYPVATVVIGGLITSTFFEFVLRPAVFWLVGRGAAQCVMSKEAAEGGECA